MLDRIQEFINLAASIGVDVSEEHASEALMHLPVAESAIEAVRAVNSSGFEPGAIFVPTKSSRTDRP
ncbi:MAG: hypothetical protein ACO3L6_04990 [Dehalococcoidia bacterium]